MKPLLKCEFASSHAHLRLLSQTSEYLVAHYKNIRDFHLDLLEIGPLISPGR